MALQAYNYLVILASMTLAGNLRALRAARGLTQVALAKKMKVKQAYLARLESGGEDNPRLDTLRRLAKALKVPVAELVK